MSLFKLLPMKVETDPPGNWSTCKLVQPTHPSFPDFSCCFLYIPIQLLLVILSVFDSPECYFLKWVWNIFQQWSCWLWPDVNSSDRKWISSWWSVRIPEYYSFADAFFDGLAKHEQIEFTRSEVTGSVWWSRAKPSVKKFMCRPSSVENRVFWTFKNGF